MSSPVTANDWTTEKILDEMLILIARVDLWAKVETDAKLADAINGIADRLGVLYQEVGKKLL